MSNPQANNLASKIKEALKPGCERIEIAGSIRRQRPIIGDIELVAIPRMIPAEGAIFDMFTGQWSAICFGK